MDDNRGRRGGLLFGFFFESGWSLCLLLLLAGALLVAAAQNNISCYSDDLSALRGFLSGLESGIDGWSGGGSDCCSWPGLTCQSSPSSVSAMRVVALDLSGMKLKGTVSGSLAGLAETKRINLSCNFLGGVVPPAIFQLPRLELLDLSCNRLSGEISPTNTSLPSIQLFNISYNSFNGSQPVLAGSTNLTVIDISSNFFSGTIDAGIICDGWPHIQVLRFSMNFFSGEIPTGIGNCSSLTELYLDANGLTGILPDELFRLPSLTQLSLQSNSLSGVLSPAIGDLTAIVSMDFSTNNFSGVIPDAFAGLGKLESFSALSNNLTGGLPASLSNLSSLSSLALRNNSLSGEIDLDFTRMTKLTVLDLGSNSFAGAIPEILSYCVGLQTLNLATNNLVGPIPESFKNLTSLSRVSLSRNMLTNLSSALEILGNFPNLTYAVLTRNFHGETMPANVQGFAGIEVLVVANCGLSGSVPLWVSRCSKLQVLDLSWNRLGGTIPSWFANLSSLFYLDLSNNSLAGEIPGGLTQLQFLISGNLSQPGSSSTEFPFFMRKNASAKGLQYNQVSSFPASLVLGHNLLVGAIPPALGDLKNLQILDLSSNNLSGPIPGELSGLTSLETMDLSSNDLTGNIPPSLAGLSFLSSFDVANNGLAGPIPTGGQFSTFSSANFAGNRGLCGFVDFPACAAPAEPPPPPPPPAGDQKKKGVLVGMALGIGIGTSLLLALLYIAVSRASSRMREDKVADANYTLPLESAAGGGGSTAAALVLLFPNKDGGDGATNKQDLSVDDIMSSTNNFNQSNIIGCGGFGLVYRATLPDGSKVAIKRLSGDFCQMEREFQAEVEALSTARHTNLVQLQGYCRIGSDRLLIYSYMENGSLDFWLHEKQIEEGGFPAAALDWPTRLGIARGAARGLAYLHQSCQPHILHRDIKSSNILLDRSFEAHLADFGLARLILPSDTHVTTDVVGTLGYIPPEYAHSSVATFKGDIYSFGVVLLELLTGRRPVDICRPKGRRELISWVAEMRRLKMEEQVFDPSVYDPAANGSEMMQMLDVAWLCVNESPKLRPATYLLVASLDSIGAPPPPPPTSIL